MPTPLTALITGASAGIGEQLANEFASHGHDLVLVARRKPALQKIAERLRAQHGISVTVKAADLSLPDAAQTLHKALGKQHIDVLVNNAGVLNSGRFKHMDEAAIDNMMTLNIVALTQLCRTFIPAMVKRGKGKILNLASIAAFQPIPNLAVYAATKAYVLSLSEALSVELASKNVSVTAVCPGYTNTDMLRGPVDAGKASIPEFVMLAPEKVAADAYRACMTGDVIKVPGIGYSAAISTTRVLPKWLVRKLTALGTGIKR
ncbi:MAG: SDR family oxidoreductase [Pseudomonadota bacterium]